MYKLYRKLFKKDSIQILVRKDFTKTPPEYVQYYQEDCTLIYSYEISCVQSIKNEVPYVISYKASKFKKQGVIKSLDIGLYNIVISFNNGLNITIPTDFVENSINKNKSKLIDINTAIDILDRAKFNKYSESKLVNKIKNNNINKWIPSYCVICGNPVIFEFKEDKVLINNKCTCGNVTSNKKEMSYKELSAWLTCQTDKNIINSYDKFWLSKE